MQTFTRRETGALVFGLSLILLLSRILPHVPNFTAAVASLIFGAAILRKIWVFAAFTITYWISDLILNNTIYTKGEFLWFSKGFVGMIAIYALLFMFIKRNFTSVHHPFRLLFISLFSSTFFFILSNFLVWETSTMYTKDFAGLLLCYLNALPFLGYECAGSLFYGSLLFGLYWLSPLASKQLRTEHAL